MIFILRPINSLIHSKLDLFSGQSTHCYIHSYIHYQTNKLIVIFIIIFILNKLIITFIYRFILRPINSLLQKKINQQNLNHRFFATFRVSSLPEKNSTIIFFVDEKPNFRQNYDTWKNVYHHIFF